MEGSIKELSVYRMERAKEMLKAAEDNLNMEQYRTSLNRSYYAIFHAMRAVNILEDYDDFYIAVKSDVVKQLENAKMFVQYIEKFISEK